MDRLGVSFSPLDTETALLAGEFWRQHRRNAGGRDRVAVDFLIGAHALRQADRLLARDRGFYRTYFTGLKVLDPSAGA
jgi:predicted nucleic acid-binding protein